MLHPVAEIESVRYTQSGHLLKVLYDEFFVRRAIARGMSIHDRSFLANCLSSSDIGGLG
jgi:hypothetical protein